MRKRLMAVLAVFVLMPLVSWSVTLHVGDEKFTPSDKAGYTYEFSSCAARASYSESKGFVLTFWGDSEVLGNISWNGPGLNVKVGFGKLVEVLGNITSSSGGLLEINGPGTVRIINGSINPYSADVKLFGAVVVITSREGKKAISTSGSVAVELSCLSIAGYGKVMRALDGFKFIASMISVLGQDYSSGDGISHKAAIEDGNSHGGGCGGISIDGCVLTIVEEHHSENAGLYTRGRLSVYDSVVTIASEGECFHAYGGSSFGNVLMLGVSRGSCSVYGNPSDDETRKAFFADGKYVFGAATAMPAIDAGHVEIDGGNLEVCAPDGGAVESYDFTMKDGSLKMVDAVDYSMVIKEMLAEGAVMGVISACSTPMEWTTVHSQILGDMIMKLTAVVDGAPEGRAEAVVKTQRFCQTGGSIDQGMAQYGCAMMLTRATFLGTWYTPAFCGGSLKSDVHRYDSGVFDDKGYYDTAPTNALGQTLTHVEYEPYWVYLNGGVTPTGCRVVFNANGGQCSTTSRQIAKGAEIGTLPTATWSGHVFDGWYTSASGGTKVTATTKVTGDVTLYAHWVSSSSGMGDVSVTSVTAQKRYPWNGLVDITVTIQGTAEDVAEADCSFAAQNGATGESIPVAHITRNGEDVGSGTTWTRKFVWDVKADVGEVRIDDVVLTVSVKTLGGVQLWENGPYWAECNVGASQPEECGYYFWWGDTVGYKRNANDDGWISVKDSTSYSFSSCPTHVKDNSQLQSEGYIDATGNLVAAHDAAAAHLGAPWRMPTETELSALINDCDTEWTSRNGVHGRLVKGRGVYASKSIFLPAAGGGNDSFLYDLGSSGDYWSSTPRSDISYYAWTLGFYSSYFLRCSSFRCTGRPVRPVRGSANPSAAIGGVTTHFSLNCREVTISFNAQGGLPTPLAITIYEGSEYGELPAVTRPGYTFLGWYTAVSGGRKILATDVVTADVTELYARWAEISGASYTVRYYYDQELNPKKYTTQRFSVGVPQSLLRVKDIGWSMEGYRFVGWKERSHSGRYADGEEVCDLTTGDGDVVYLHACWEPIKYRTVFHKNDGSDEIFSQVHLFDSSQRLCDIKSIMGWSNGELGFVGWATRETGDVMFSNRESVVNLTSVQDGQIHLYAIWGTMHVVAFKSNSTKYGSVTVKNASATVKSGSKVAADTELSLKATAKSGYVFAGWYTDKDCTKKLNPEGYDNREPKITYVMPAKKTTLYAKFISKSSDKKSLKFTSATKKLATTATSFAAGKEMSALTIKASSASLATLSMKDLPKGMSFNPATGKITGTPTVPGKYVATVTVKSAAGNKISQKVKIYVTVPSGYYGTFDGYALVGTKPAYVTFTSDKYGAVSGKVTYKGKGCPFTANYSAVSSSRAKFTPSIKIGSKTYKPVTYVKKATDGITVSEARGEQEGKFVFVAQKRPGLIKSKKALAGLIDQTMKISNKQYADAKLPKSSDGLTLKFAATDVVKVTGKLKGKSVSFSTTVIYCGVKGDAACGPEDVVYTAEVALIEPKSGYSRLATFTLTVGKGGKVGKAVTFGKIQK